jgi:hypothetical protein
MAPREPSFGIARNPEKVRAAVARYGSELVPRMSGDGRSEDKLRAPVYALLKDLGRILGPQVVVHDEVTLSEPSCRPDFAVDTPSGRVGYVELKALEKGIPEDWSPTPHDREQWRKFRSLPNLIYTNGKRWALYRKGILVGQVSTMRGDLYRAGASLSPDSEFERLHSDFLAWKPDRPLTLRALVSEIAPLCRLLRDQVAETVEFEGSRPGKRPLTTLANEWRAILFPTLGDKEFSDAYA